MALSSLKGASWFPQSLAALCMSPHRLGYDLGLHSRPVPRRKQAMRPAKADVHSQDACHDSPLHERPAHGGQQALRHDLQVHGEAPH